MNEHEDEDAEAESRTPSGHQALLGFDWELLRAVELSEKHGVDAGAIRDLLRAYPELRRGDDVRKHKLIDPETEARIVSHPEFKNLPRS